MWHRQERPGPDTVPTFQNAEMTRCLIGQNTYCISSIWMQRDYFTQKDGNSGKQWKQGIAWKSVHAKLPFHTGSEMPNSTTRSGSFQLRPGYPVLVRISIPRLVKFTLFFSCFRSFPCLEEQAWNSEDSGQTRVNTGQQSQNWPKESILVNNSQSWPET